METEERPGRGAPVTGGDTDTVWGSQHIMNNSGDNGQQQEMPPPLLSARTDTINSFTNYASMDEVLPRNNVNERYSGVSISVMDMENNPQYIVPVSVSSDQVYGVKRQAEEEAEQDNKRAMTVEVVTADGQRQQIDIGNIVDPFEDMDIPLGTEAETMTQTSVITKHEQAGQWTQPQPMTIVPQHQLTAPSRSPTCSNPSVDDYPGHHMFDVSFAKCSTNQKNKYWDYSNTLKKLFIDMNKMVQVEFKVGARIPNDLFIRILPVYSDASNCREPVKRCPNHASPADPSNTNFDYPHHLVRVDNNLCQYDEDDSSGRLSTKFPVSNPHVGSDTVRELIKFMCLGSDVGGINRRSLKVIFTLETGSGDVVGRKVFDVRICSCPRRDKQQEEEKNRQLEDKVRNIGEKFANSTVVINTNMPPPGKKLLKKTEQKYIMVPIFVDDFKHMNDTAESLLIAREVQKDPGNAKQIIARIKEERRLLMVEHNPDKVPKKK